MEFNDKLEEKLINSNQHIDSILNSIVQVKFICSINNKIMIDKDRMTLPKISINKRMLNNNTILKLITEELNIPVLSIKAIPFEYYKNYDERYYLMMVDIDQITSLDSKYTFEDLEKITDIKECNIINKILGN